MIIRQVPLISVVIAAYNETENLSELYRQLVSVFSSLDANLELLVIDDGSSDGTLDWLRSTSQTDQRVRYVSFSRNFGHQAAVTAGLRHASGDAVIVMDADLQDPPQVIPEMLQRWREGFSQVVRGTRARRESDPWSKRLFAWCYYRLLGRLANGQIPVDSGDLYLLTSSSLIPSIACPNVTAMFAACARGLAFNKSISPLIGSNVLVVHQNTVF